jgi:hypothetical protein
MLQCETDQLHQLEDCRSNQPPYTLGTSRFLPLGVLGSLSTKAQEPGWEQFGLDDQSHDEAEIPVVAERDDNLRPS